MSIDKIRFIAWPEKAGKIMKSGLEGRKVEEKVELPEETMMLFAEEKAKKLGVIRAKVKSDFYFRPEVKEKVVEGLLRDFKNTAVR